MRAVPTLALFAVLAAGCTASAVPAEPTLLRVIMADDWASAPAVRDVLDAFERDHEQVQVQVQAVPFSQIPDLVSAAQDLEQPYDLAHWHAFAAAAADLAEPLGAQWRDAGLRADEFLPGAVEDVTWLGEPYGVPLDTNALVLLTDLNALEEAGVASPGELRTMEGFHAAAEKVVAGGGAQWMLPISTSSWQAYGWIRAFGGELLRIDQATGEPTFTFDHPRTVAALEFLVDLIRTDLAPGPYGADLAADTVQAFASGQVATHATGSWDLNIVARSADRDLRVGVLPLPQADPDEPVTVLGGSSLFVPTGAEQPELAFELALRLIDDDVALRLAEEEGRLPARIRVFDAPLFTEDPLLSTFVQQLPNARVMPLIAYPDVAQAFSEALNDILSGHRPAVESMADLQEFAEAWLASDTGA
ncbi:extracellular solute-binding protein [Egicoccus sp. AB-alg2]|uniref:extracellular solute-binding protein n=1 Tax=Egicoccus sp. AB-alg2 TaxID=3242693 RepID=UPI00359E4C7B